MKNITEQNNFEQLYRTVDWIDLSLVGILIFYYGRLGANLEFPSNVELDYALIMNLIMESVTLIGIILLLVSLIVCTTLIYLTIKSRRARMISAPRAIGRLIFNGFFFLLDVSFLLMIIAFFFS